MGRSIVIVLLILVVLVSIHPQTQANLVAAWDNIRPAVIESMDSMYAVVRNFVAGDDSDHQIYENPVTPGVNFDVIITMRSALPL